MNIFNKIIEDLTHEEVRSIYEITDYEIIIKSDGYADIEMGGHLVIEISQKRTIYYALKKILYYIEQEKIKEGKEQIKEQFRYLLK
jgi:hypothetical protein